MFAMIRPFAEVCIDIISVCSGHTCFSYIILKLINSNLKYDKTMSKKYK